MSPSNEIMLRKVNSGEIAFTSLATEPVMATFTIACPTTPAIAAGAAKVLGFLAGAGIVTGAAYAGYQVVANG